MEERVKKEARLQQKPEARRDPSDLSQGIDLADLGIPRLTPNRNAGASSAPVSARAESPRDESQPSGDVAFAQDGGVPDGGAPDAGTPADAGTAASATLSVDAPAMTDTESQKLVTFNATWSGGAKEDYIIVNWLKGSIKKPDGTPFKVSMYGKLVDFNFADFQVDSVDEDPAYWSDPGTGRWNYNVDGAHKFSATDKPGPPSFDKGTKAHVDFKTAVYKSADVPNKTTGSLAATPLTAFQPWAYNMEVLGGGKFSH
jgi:hypothetical protein